MKTPIVPNAERAARLVGCTVEQAKRMFAKNAVGFSEMADKAARTGKKVNGYTEIELRTSAKQFAEASK